MYPRKLKKAIELLTAAAAMKEVPLQEEKTVHAYVESMDTWIFLYPVSSSTPKSKTNRKVVQNYNGFNTTLTEVAFIGVACIGAPHTLQVCGTDWAISSEYTIELLVIVY